MRKFVLAGVAAGVAFAMSATGPIVFEEIAGRAGIDFQSNSSPTPNKNQPETMVAGVALLDYDRDGYLDIYFVNGAAIPSLNKEGPAYWNRLYHNNRDGTFTDVTAKAGVAGAGYGRASDPQPCSASKWRSRIALRWP
jgi:signal transduction histidine kinase